MATKLVVVVGVGAVGSQLSKELANNRVGHLCLFDGKSLDRHNLPRHALTSRYLGENKAAGMARYCREETPLTEVEAHALNIDLSMQSGLLDALLHDANLIIAATDDREVQRLLGRRALALDIPAIFPGLYDRDGGEVFVQRSPRSPCYLCWDAFRDADHTLRGVAANDSDIFGVLGLAGRLSLGILDPSADYLQRLMRPNAGESGSPQLFIDNGLGLAKQTVRRRANCPSCAVGPSALRSDATTTWHEAERARTAREPRHEIVPSVVTPSAFGQAHQPASQSAPHFDFVGWIGSCILCSIVMLVPDIFISVWIRAIVDGGSAGFSFKLYIILSGILGTVIGTIMSVKDG
jgi:hypothetical protein